MPNYNTSEQSPHARATAEMRRDMFTEVIRTARHAVDHALSQGDHPEVWELICNLPDMAGPQHVKWYISKGETEDIQIPVYLNARDREKLSDEIRQYALDHGWDEAKGKAVVTRMMEQRQGRIAGLAAAMKGRVGG